MTGSALWTKPFIYISLANFFMFLGFQVVMPAVPLHLDSLGVDSSQVGLVLASFSLLLIVARPLAAAFLVDRGKERFCVALGIIISLAALAGYWLAPALLFFTLARMLHGGGFGCSSVAFGAMVTSLVPAHRRTEGLSYFALSISLAICLGPFTGTTSMEYLGFSWTLFISGAFTVLAFIWLALLPKSEKPVEQKTKLSFAQFFEKKVWFPCVLCALIGMAQGAIVGFIALWGRDINITNGGIFFLLNALASLLVRFFTGRIADTMGRVYVIIPSIILMGAALFILFYFTSYAGMIWASILMGLGLGSVYPALQAWAMDLASVERRGAATAFFYNAFDLGIGGSIIICGFLASRFSYAHMYGYASLSMVLFMVCYVAHLLRSRKKGKLYK